MIIFALIVFGLCLGSFVNALVWRTYTNENTKSKKYSITKGRSVCVHCKHELVAKDLVPILSWVTLRGKCRYCKKPISKQYPAIEALTAALIVVSYLLWPFVSQGWSAGEMIIFVLWSIIVTLFVALSVYDLRWQLLPDKIVLPATIVGVLMVIARAITYSEIAVIWHSLLGAGIVFGVFYLLYRVSDGKWIGGGDVKLGFVLGLLSGGVTNAFVMLFLASLFGTLFAVFLSVARKQKLHRKVTIPFGPFLLAATYIVVLVGVDIVDWYTNLILSV